ncbi:hypothetical protein ACFQX6_10955 [Streptosporangium lutulentum]
MAINIGDLYATLSFRDQMTGPFSRATAGIKVNATGIHAALIAAGMAAGRMSSAVVSGAASTGKAIASAGAKSGALLAGVGAAGVAVGGAVAFAFAGAALGIAKLGINAAMAAPAVKAAFGDLKTSVQADMADAATVFQAPLIQAAGSLKTMFSSEIAPALQGMFTDLAPLIGDFTSGLGDFLQPMLPAVSGLVAAVAPMLSQLAGSLGTFGGQIAGFMEPITQALSQNSGLLATLVTGIGGVLQSIGPVLAALVQVAGQVAGPLFAALAGVGNALSTSLAPVLIQLGPVIAQIVTAFGAILTAVIPLLPPFLQLAATLATSLMPVLVQIAQSLTAALQPVLVALQPVLAQVASAFGQVITALLPILPPLSQLLVGLLPPIVTIIKALTPVLTLLAGVFVKLVAAVTPFLPPLMQLATAVIPLVLSAVQAVIKLFQGDFRGAFDLIKNAVGVFGKTVTEAFKKLQTLGSDMVNGIIQGFQNTWNKFTSSVGNLINGFLGWIKGLLGINSPSTVFAEFGMFSVLGLAKGIKDNEKIAMSAAKIMVDKVQSVARDGLGRIVGTATKFDVPLPKPKNTIEGSTGNGGSVVAIEGGGGFSGQNAAARASQVTVHVTNNYPQAEPTSKTVNRGLQYAAAAASSPDTRLAPHLLKSQPMRTFQEVRRGAQRRRPGRHDQPAGLPHPRAPPGPERPAAVRGPVRRHLRVDRCPSRLDERRSRDRRGVGGHSARRARRSRKQFRCHRRSQLPRGRRRARRDRYRRGRASGRRQAGVFRDGRQRHDGAEASGQCVRGPAGAGRREPAFDLRADDRPRADSDVRPDRAAAGTTHDGPGAVPPVGAARAAAHRCRCRAGPVSARRRDGHLRCAARRVLRRDRAGGRGELGCGRSVHRRRGLDPPGPRPADRHARPGGRAAHGAGHGCPGDDRAGPRWCAHPSAYAGRAARRRARREPRPARRGHGPCCCRRWCSSSRFSRQR